MAINRKKLHEKQQITKKNERAGQQLYWGWYNFEYVFEKQLLHLARILQNNKLKHQKIESRAMEKFKE